LTTSLIFWLLRRRERFTVQHGALRKSLSPTIASARVPTGLMLENAVIRWPPSARAATFGAPARCRSAAAAS
jgi:hypothetical protein